MPLSRCHRVDQVSVRWRYRAWTPGRAEKLGKQMRQLWQALTSEAESGLSNIYNEYPEFRSTAKKGKDKGQGKKKDTGKDKG